MKEMIYDFFNEASDYIVNDNTGNALEIRIKIFDLAKKNCEENELFLALIIDQFLENNIATLDIFVQKKFEDKDKQDD